jgi:4-hydroxy-2-oxoheptanedioate aldolase
MAEPYLAEVAATARYDWLLIDGEHAPNDLRSTLAALQAIQGHPDSHAVVRVPHDGTALIKQVLDIGAKTLLVPMVDTAEQARAVAAATQYPPRGVRGVGSAVARSSLWTARADYMDVADDEICLLVQAETVTAMRNLREICAVDGVHGIFIGPADLSASMGHRDNPGHPEVQAAIESAIATIVASGKAAGIPHLRPGAGRGLPAAGLHLRGRGGGRAAVRPRGAAVARPVQRWCTVNAHTRHRLLTITWACAQSVPAHPMPTALAAAPADGRDRPRPGCNHPGRSCTRRR